MKTAVEEIIEVHNLQNTARNNPTAILAELERLREENAQLRKQVKELEEPVQHCCKCGAIWYDCRCKEGGE